MRPWTTFLAAPAALILLIVSPTFADNIWDTGNDGVTWDNEHWRIKTTTLEQGDYHARMSLANGYLGINVASAGPFFESDIPAGGDNINGWPLFQRRQTFATIAGFYDSQPTTNSTNFPWLYQYGYDSVISGVPHWSALAIEANGNILDATVNESQISNYRSTLDVGAGGLMTWEYTWTPPNTTPIEVTYSMFVHKVHINRAAVRLQLKAREDIDVTVIDVLHGDCAVRTDFVGGDLDGNSSVYSAVNPWGLPDVKAYIYSTLEADQYADLSTRQLYLDERVLGTNASSKAQSISVSLKAETSAVVTKYIGAASSDSFDDPQEKARNASLTGAETGFEDLLKSHTEEWQSIMTLDSVDNYSHPNNTQPEDRYRMELHITAITNPFQLLQNTLSENALGNASDAHDLDTFSIPVGGLGSDSYGGQVFWDADVWMAPGLMVTHPFAALQIVKKRKAQFAQAQRNVQTAYQSSQNPDKFRSSGAVFPWTTGRFGNCTASGPCYDYEYHINGDIGLMLYNWLSVSGDWDGFKEDYWPIHESIAEFYYDLLDFNISGTGQWELLNATDPVSTFTSILPICAHEWYRMNMRTT